jgi:hypothetical protein
MEERRNLVLYSILWLGHTLIWFFTYGSADFGVMKPESLVAYEDGVWFPLFFMLLPSTLVMLVFSFFLRHEKQRQFHMVLVCVPFVHVFFLRVYYISEYGVNLCGKQSFFPLRAEYFSNCF